MLFQIPPIRLISRNRRLAAALAACAVVTAGASAITPSDIADRLDAIGDYAAHVTYSVLLPSAPDDIIYDIDLSCTPAFGAIKTGEDATGGETSPDKAATAPDDGQCNYLIDWTLPTPGGEANGFTAYFNGHLYRFRDHRLQEYHYEWDSIPFITGGGVHRMAQFVDLLPESIAATMRRYAANPGEYPLTCREGVKIDGRECVTVEGTREVNGLTASEFLYVFDSSTMEPMKIELENNPGAISEQTVTAIYGTPRLDVPDTWCERMLMERYPEEFERFRQSNFRVENLPGTPLPSFSLPTVTGERHSYQRGDRLTFPTIIAIIDESTVNAAETVNALRSAIASLPKRVDLIMAFTGNRIDEIEEVAGAARMGETMLMSARTLARDCGVTSFPTLIFTGRDGIVTHSHLGFNNHLDEIVIQSAALTE